MAKSKQGRKGATEAHRDPISGEPGAHPLGVGLGAAGAATAGAAVGSLGGPVTAVLGAAVGGVLGGIAGKSAAEVVLRTDWEQDPHGTALDWDEASPAARDAWERIRPGVDYSEENR